MEQLRVPPLPPLLLLSVACCCCSFSLGFAALGTFRQVPQDVTAREGEDVEMSCAFHGGGAPAYSLEIQWWFVKGETREAARGVALDDGGPRRQMVMKEEGTKISVVRVLGSDISNRLRLTSVRRGDEGAYECRVTDYRPRPPQEHTARAWLRVTPRPEDMQAAQAQPIVRNDTSSSSSSSASSSSSSSTSSSARKAAKEEAEKKGEEEEEQKKKKKQRAAGAGTKTMAGHLLPWIFLAAQLLCAVNPAR
ncbi:V-set and transmembrane domain-containing protein 2B-like [Lethenteron reissneri]|uniref:V-set and transmembrane domain-containing protein 2B-like n=1 Tax=Lethenteron reissneri TaxID=7753 RepID=UPI002AB79812|nr:V-set and transmembrane domain-containing protein 2B-like [Lethenteron reissneri]